MAETNAKEGASEVIIKRLRCRILRQAFDLYVAGLKYKRKVEIDEERCKYYNRTRDERLLKTIIN
jgi:hypothetical protein